MSLVRQDGRPIIQWIKRNTCIAVTIFTLFGNSDLRADYRVDYDPIRGSNLCLPDAVGFQMALQVQYPNTWSRILRLNWNVKIKGQNAAHAYCIYEINHKLYAYDSQGGQRQLDLDVSAKRQPDVLGHYLGKKYYASAAYLPGFDPVRLATTH